MKLNFFSSRMQLNRLKDYQCKALDIALNYLIKENLTSGGILKLSGEIKDHKPES